MSCAMSHLRHVWILHWLLWLEIGRHDLGQCRPPRCYPARGFRVASHRLTKVGRVLSVIITTVVGRKKAQVEKAT